MDETTAGAVAASPWQGWGATLETAWAAATDGSALWPALLLGMLAGALLMALWMRSRRAVSHALLAAQAREMEALRDELGARAEVLEAERAARAESDLERARSEAALEQEQRTSAEKLELLGRAEQQLREAFSALSADALRKNNQSFLDLAQTQMKELQKTAAHDLDQRRVSIEQMVKPVQESLLRVDTKLAEVEKSRVEMHGQLRQQVGEIAESHRRLSAETSNLVKALRRPQVRGRWGELQLRRVVELAGMVDRCDFAEQVSVGSDEGRLRPDLVVRLPGGKQVVVDAKAPLDAYLEAVEAGDEKERLAQFRRHARQVRDHVNKLAAKSYWSQFQPSPDFVVLFLPGETFFAAALEHDPGLLEDAVTKRVIPASPTTLITLLKAVAYGWQQEVVAESAREISELGRQLYERLGVLARHFGTMRKGLERAVGAYNDAVGCVETRLLPSARRFRDLEVGEGELVETGPVEVAMRPLHAPELTSSSSEEDEDPSV